MRKLMLITAALLMLAEGSVVDAADRKFPYEAIVDVEDGEVVRSGGGPKFYATDKLRKGDRVMVQRHDPGGWCMITPPPGSYSWVRAEHIKKSGNGTGVLKTSGVVVHTGSSLFPDNITTVQSNLSQGDAVEILGEKTFSTEDGPRLMYKISPVKREWRWIARKSIVAVDAIKSEPFPEEQPAKKKRNGPVAQLEEEPFTKPISSRPMQPEDVGSSSQLGTSADEPAVRQKGPGSDLTASARKQLEDIDQQFRDMIRQDPSTWDLNSLESQYQQLDDDIGTASMSSLISLRQDAVKRYRKTHQDYMEFFKLTNETKQRDAQLKALQGQPDSRPQTLSGPPPTVSNVPPMNSTKPLAPNQPQSMSPTSQPQAKPAPAFDGAGVVQKMSQTFPGGPQFVLTTPEGRMLSFLQPGPGVDLNRYVGRAMGVTGQRVHRDDWNSDVITVRGLQPVQLRSSR